jgi:hypothetical protein
MGVNLLIPIFCYNYYYVINYKPIYIKVKNYYLLIVNHYKLLHHLPIEVRKVLVVNATLIQGWQMMILLVNKGQQIMILLINKFLSAIKATIKFQYMRVYICLYL